MVVLAIAAGGNLELCQLDTKSAFLQAMLKPEECVYVETRKGVQPASTGMFLFLPEGVSGPSCNTSTGMFLLDTFSFPKVSVDPRVRCWWPPAEAASSFSLLGCMLPAACRPAVAAMRPAATHQRYNASDRSIRFWWDPLKKEALCWLLTHPKTCISV